MRTTVWDVLVLAGFVALVSGIGTYSAPLALVIGGALFMFAGILGARGRHTHPQAPDQAQGKG